MCWVYANTINGIESSHNYFGAPDWRYAQGEEGKQNCNYNKNQSSMWAKKNLVEYVSCRKLFEQHPRGSVLLEPGIYMRCEAKTFFINDIEVSVSIAKIKPLKILAKIILHWKMVWRYRAVSTNIVLIFAYCLWQVINSSHMMKFPIKSYISCVHPSVFMCIICACLFRLWHKMWCIRPYTLCVRVCVWDSFQI